MWTTGQWLFESFAIERLKWTTWGCWWNIKRREKDSVDRKRSRTTYIWNNREWERRWGWNNKRQRDSGKKRVKMPERERERERETGRSM